ncbi:MAG: lipocalin-like domain-containing protein [Burkholderiales bacterium]
MSKVFILHPSSLRQAQGRLFILAFLILHPFGEPRAGPSCFNLAFSAPYASVERGYQLTFPADEGSHPEFRTEWWYATGWLASASGKPFGFQVTFFRTRLFEENANPSAFAPRQILFAHAAIADERAAKLVHDEIAAREGFGLAGAKEGEMNVWIKDWHFRDAGDYYSARVHADEFALDLRLTPTQAPLLQGDEGFSRKGTSVESASHYYSLPQLAVSGSVTVDGKIEAVMGKAWLDHEWSSTLLEDEAVGWDWIGINLADGAALMAFQIRDKKGGKHWAGGSYRSAQGSVGTFGPDEISFTPLKMWQSPRTGTTYPIEWRVRAGEVELMISPLMEDQELNARTSTGTLYWEGAVRAYRKGELIGKGYLELTGYNKPLRLD